MASHVSAFNIFRKVSPYARGNKGKFVYNLLLTLLGSLVTALQPWPLRILGEYALTSSELPVALPWFPADAAVAESAIILIALAAAASLSLFLLNSALEALLTYIGSSLGQGMVYACEANGLPKFVGAGCSELVHVGGQLLKIGADSTL